MTKASTEPFARSETDLEAPRQMSGLWTRTVIAVLEHVGMDAEAICERANLDYELLSYSDSRIPWDDAVRLWEAAIEISGDITLGLHAGDQLPGRANNVLAMLAINGRTVGEGIITGVRHQAVLTNGEIVTIEEDGTDKMIRFHRIEDALPTSPQQIEFTVAAVHRLLSTMTLNAFRANEVRFEHCHRGFRDEYERIFECPVRFEQPTTGIVVSREVWNMELEGWDPALRNRLEAIAAELYERIQSPSFLRSVSHAIRSLLPQTKCDVAATADRLNITTDALQRRLSEEGAQFRDVVDATRLAIVKEGINRDLNPEEIERQAGFSTSRALQRSIRRWRLEGREGARERRW